MIDSKLSRGSKDFFIRLLNYKNGNLHTSGKHFVIVLFLLSLTLLLNTSLAAAGENPEIGAVINAAPPCLNTSVPAVNTLRNNMVSLPISVGDTTGSNVLSYDFTVTYNPAVLAPLAPDQTGTLSSGMVVTVIGPISLAMELLSEMRITPKNFPQNFKNMISFSGFSFV